jgi:dynein heavy chain, axonemal
MNVYLQSKLRKLMTQLKFIMQDSLRYLAESSNSAFTKLITVSTALEVDIKSFDEVTSIVLGGSADTKRPPPLFVLDVLIASKTNKLHLSHDLDVVKALPLRLFDAATNIMQGILNLEPQVLSNMFWPEKTTLSAPDRNEPMVAEQRKQIARAMEEAIKPLYRYLESLAPLEAVLQIDTAAVIKQWEASTPEAIAAQLQSYQAKRNQMDEKIPKQIAVGCFTVVTDRVRKSVVAKYMELIEGLGGAIATSTRKKAESVSRSFEEIFSNLRRTPNTIEEIVESREYAAGLQPTLNELKVQVEQAFSNYDLLDGLFYNYSNSDMKQRWHIFELPHVIQSRILEAQKMYTAKETELDQEQTQVQDDFNDEIKSMDKIVKGFATRTVPWTLGVGVEGTALDAVADEVTRIQKRISEAEVSARTFNSRELLFGKPQTDYGDIARVTKAFEPYSNLWLAMRDFQNAKKKWMSDPFNTLDAEEIEKSISTWWRTVFKACKTLQVCSRHARHFRLYMFRIMFDLIGTLVVMSIVFGQDGDAELLEMANTVKKDMEAFKNNVPIVVALRLPGMRDRHWEKLSKEIKMDINLTGSVTLHDVLFTMELPRFMQQITTVGDFASKEYLIEKTLEKMTSSWVGVNLDLIDYRDTGTQILRGLDEIMQQLDDNIVMTQSIAFSPFKGPFEQEIETWEKKLLLAQEILDEWVACQRLWLYLEPIFGSEDIQKQLPGKLLANYCERVATYRHGLNFFNFRREQEISGG